MNYEFDIAVETANTDVGQPGLAAKLSSPSSELNIWFTSAEASELVDHWEAHTLSGRRLGKSAGLPVLWSLDNESHVYLLLGGDDTTWDIGFTLSVENAGALVHELRSATSPIRPHQH
jgi:hypothetical protein